MRCGVCRTPVDRDAQTCPSCGWAPRDLEKYMEVDGEYHVRQRSGRVAPLLKLIGTLIASFCALWFLVRLFRWMWNTAPF
jgi:hypothetical protein